MSTLSPGKVRGRTTSFSSVDFAFKDMERMATGTNVVKKKREGKNLNPLAPCGACKEWLKKIAKTNPDFKIITFDDATCEYAYVSELN